MGEEVHHQREDAAGGSREKEIVHARHFTAKVGHKINWASLSLSLPFLFSNRLLLQPLFKTIH